MNDSPPTLHGASTSATPTHLITAARACARHERFEASATCISCATPLCAACMNHGTQGPMATHVGAHKRCPACSLAEADAPLVVDGAWRMALVAEGIGDAWRELPRRTPALLGLAALSLSVALAGHLLDVPEVGWVPVHTTSGVVAWRYGAFAWVIGLCTLPSLSMPGGSGRRRALAVIVGFAGWTAAALLVGWAVNANAVLRFFAVLTAFLLVPPFVLAVQGQVLDGVPLLRAARDAWRRPLSGVLMHASFAATVAILVLFAGSLLWIGLMAAAQLIGGDVGTALAFSITASVMATIWLGAIAGYARAAARFAEDARIVDSAR